LRIELTVGFARSSGPEARGSKFVAYCDRLTFILRA
jgi:hypothetical protein